MSTDNDPVSAKSTFLTSYMSQHADTLVAYILFYLQSPAWSGPKFKTDKEKESKTSLKAGDIQNPKMLKISSKEMTIQYRDARAGRGETKKVDIPFDPPMLAYNEVRPRLLQMKIEAEDGIGMPKRPTITTYRLPSRRNTLIVVSIILFWVFTALAKDPNDFFGRIRRIAGGDPTIRGTGMLMVSLHAAEAAFQYRSCLRFNMPMQQTIFWTLSTLFLGWASLLQFRRVVREARIAGITKVD